ncbi:hypothetical protein AX16_006533 [Volvariella volvacea WC 439]|nr:hypothetical protein AX16_006533 [Volvariella volvacea WC 439]
MSSPPGETSLFQHVVYHLEHSIPPHRRTGLDHVLQTHRATPATGLKDPNLTHIITNSHRFEGWQDVSPTTLVVTDKWIERSVLVGRLMPAEHYSPNPAMIFSGVVACATELPVPDLEVLSAGITALGGQWRTGLTKDVTHLFAIGNTSTKYATALHFKEYTSIKVLLPHWFDDAVRLGMGNLDTKPYEWPEPPLLRQLQLRSSQEGNDPQTKMFQKLDAQKKSLFRTALISGAVGGSEDEEEMEVPDLMIKDVWQGRKVLLSLSLGLREQMRQAVGVGISRTKGVPLTPHTKEEELEMIDECDVLVVRYRAGKAYVRAVRQAKTIGTLAWLFHVQGTGVLTRPMDQLLHYPIPKRPIDGFIDHEITLTNYTGEAREYLKKLITTMGATFTPSMSGRNTVLVAAYISGTKTTKAAAWSIPIVNHTWLEDCFVKWRNLTVALEKYIVFPPGIDFSVGLGERGVGRAVEEISEEELAELEAEDEDEAMQLDDPVNSDAETGVNHNREARLQAKERRLTQGPNGTQGSARDEQEVEAAVFGRNNKDADMNPLEDELPTRIGVVTGAGRDHGNDSEAQPRPTPRKATARGTKPRQSPSSKGDVTKPDSNVAHHRDFGDGEVHRPSSSPAPLPRNKILSKKITQVASIQNDDVEEQNEENEEKEVKVGPPSRATRKTYRKSLQEKRIQQEQDSSEEEEEGVVAIMKSTKAKATARGRHKGKQISGGEEDGVEQVFTGRKESVPNASGSHQRGGATAKPQSRSRTPRLRQSDSSDADRPPAQERSPSKTKLPASSPTTQRMVSVMIPNLSLNPKKARQPEDDKMEVEDGPPRAGASRGKGRAKEKETTASKKAAREGDGLESQPEEDEKDESPVSTKRKPPQQATKPKGDPTHEDEKNKAKAKSTLPPASTTPAPPRAPASHTQSSPAPSTARGSVQRNAAAKATRKLHEEIMPDVLNFEDQLRKHIKSGGKKNFGGAAAPEEVVVSGESKEKGKKNKRNEEDDSDTEGGSDNEEDDVFRGRKRRKVSGAKQTNLDEDAAAQKATTKHKGKAPRDVAMDVDDEAPRRSSPLKCLDKPGSRVEKPNRQITIMTTQVNLGDDTTKALTKLGVKITTRAVECTHLIVPHLVRTEKFLCALAVAPYILTEKWIRDSVAAKKLQPEEKYILEDAANEVKYGFKLADALERAKQLRGTLFVKKTFYITPKVPIDLKLLKNVISSSGGQVSTQIPTVRMLSANRDRYVVSCPEDVSIWRPIAIAGHAIYLPEFLLTSVLRQQVDWDNEAFKVPGSFELNR